MDWDTSDFERGMNSFEGRAERKSREALGVVGDELLRLSAREVPHDKGTLQNTGVSQPDGDDHIVGYSTPYAARLHEHPEYRFGKGRKGKYLEDPLKMNLTVFLNYYNEKMKEAF